MVRLSINKTYKLYIGGKFPRTESGRSYEVTDPKGGVIAQACLASRKDLRNAVEAARAGWQAWSSKTAYNRSQILYRMAEMLDGRSDQMIRELQCGGMPAARARKEVELSADRLVYYAGWCDKLPQVFGTVNPVAHPHFCFSQPESIGIIGAVASEDSPLLGFISLLAPILAGGNSLVILASESNPLPALTFAESLATSDLPGGTVNVLSGSASELISHFASHRELQGLVVNRADLDTADIQIAGADNMKRLSFLPATTDWTQESEQHPYYVQDHMEIKTTWHPVGSLGGGGSAY